MFRKYTTDRPPTGRPRPATIRYGRIAEHSTITYARADHPPILFVDSTGDDTVCLDGFHQMRARLSQAGSKARFVELEWAAVNHHDTEHPHARVVIRGVDRGQPRTVQKPIAADCCTIRRQTAGLKMRQIAGSLGPT